MIFNWYSLSSLSIGLGLAAWVLPLIGLRRRRWYGFCMASVACCALALLGQIVYQWHLVEIGDFSALMDTAWALVLVSGFLVVTTLVENLACCRVRWRRE